ncbi:MAG: hypothetical protein JXR91_07380 [Deltaproteobacteria bacterium]|nr:hypothetical protein [Deltaproteobacteria bacterium]
MWYLKSLKIIIPVLTAIFAIAHFANAQSVDDWRNATSNNNQSFKLVQSYTGTTPGAGNTLPKVEELKSLEGAYITWPGFSMQKDGSSRIFLQTTQNLEYSQKNSKKNITITFKDTKIFLPNNKNPLITTHFNTPMDRAYLKKHKKNVQLVLKLKVASEVTISQVQIEDGYNYVFIDFPAGDYPKGTDNSPRPTFSGGGDNTENQNNQTEQVNDQESPF